MNYLQLVNGVLTRLREPMVTTVRTQDDPVVNLVKQFVNDAKRHVEGAHSWNATRKVWTFGTEENKPSYVLDETDAGSRVTAVWNDQNRLDQWDLTIILGHRSSFGNPYRYAFEGTDDNGNVMLRLDPIPNAVFPIQVLGHRNLSDFDLDTDSNRLPDQPILYYALALAARERGEVGGQTATELFNMAQQYIFDAIALDANLSETEHSWAVI